MLWRPCSPRPSGPRAPAAPSAACRSRCLQTAASAPEISAACIIICDQRPVDQDMYLQPASSYVSLGLQTHPSVIVVPCRMQCIRPGLRSKEHAVCSYMQFSKHLEMLHCRLNKRKGICRACGVLTCWSHRCSWRSPRQTPSPLEALHLWQSCWLEGEGGFHELFPCFRAALQVGLAACLPPWVC